MYEYDNFSEFYYIKSFMIKFFLIKNKRTVVQVSDLTNWPFVKLRIERYSIKGKQRGLAVRVIFFPFIISSLVPLINLFEIFCLK